jgi:ferredoxin
MMAKIKFRNQDVDIEDGSFIQETCQSFGIDFGCRNGFCRTCEITVIEGSENLTPQSENEEFIRLRPPKRLACQCKLLHGIVVIDKEDLY